MLAKELAIVSHPSERRDERYCGCGLCDNDTAQLNHIFNSLTTTLLGKMASSCSRGGLGWILGKISLLKE